MGVALSDTDGQEFEGVPRDSHDAGLLHRGVDEVRSQKGVRSIGLDFFELCRTVDKERNLTGEP